MISATPELSEVSELAPDLFGGPQLAEALEPVRRAATSSLPMVIVGATGTGKECVGRAIHHWSGRGGGFHAVNCAALPENLVEAELFGYAKGAFTGAASGSVGRIRAADGGTLLLDEIVDLPLHIQPKLLRLLEERAVVPLGDSRPHRVDVRVVATAQAPLELLVERGTFRRDLWARLAGLVVRLPPLRERRPEIVPLFRELLRVHTGNRPPALEAKLGEALCLHAWPNNVRELDLLVRRMLALHGSEPILKRTFLPEAIRSVTRDESGASIQSSTRQLHDLANLKVALRRTNGNIKAAAASLGFSRQRAYRLMASESARGSAGGSAGELEADCVSLAGD